MRKLIGAALAVAVAGFLAPAPQAWATGGTYPSNAPTITPGSTVSGGNPHVDNEYCNQAGHNGTEYYKVNLGAGDHLIVDLTDITGQGSDVCLFAPSVTDYTIASASVLQSAYTPSTHKVEMTYIAPTAGTYLLAPSAVDSGESWGYSMIVNVLHGSTVSASGPQGVKVGHKIKVVGQATAVGQVTLQLKSGGWQTVAQANTGADGTFKFALKAAHTGLYKLRVVFAAPGYLGSQTPKIKVRVHG